MSETDIGGGIGRAIRHEHGKTDAFGATDWICLAAAPTFALMALLTALPSGGSSEMSCSHASPLGGMVPMYLLMSAFHSVPWLKLISRRTGGV
jgi:hypothetical protein